MASNRDRYVRTASRLFREKGFEATSVGEIATVGGLAAADEVANRLPLLLGNRP